MKPTCKVLLHADQNKKLLDTHAHKQEANPNPSHKLWPGDNAATHELEANNEGGVWQKIIIGIGVREETKS